MDRRTLLQGLVAIPAVSCVMPTSASSASPDAELIRICAEHIVNMHAYNAAEGGPVDPEDDPLWVTYMATHDAIDEAEPQTFEGLVAKARAAKAEADAGELDPGDAPHGTAAAYAWGLVNDLLRLGGAA